MTYIVSSGALNSTPTNQLSASISPELHVQFSQFFAHVTSATLPQVHSWTILHLQNNGCQPAVSRTKKKHSIQPLVTNTLALAKFVVVFLARTIQRARQLGIGPFTEAQPNPIQPTRGNYCAVAIRRVLLLTLCLHITVTAARKVTQRGQHRSGGKV